MKPSLLLEKRLKGNMKIMVGEKKLYSYHYICHSFGKKMKR
jgi:hypothetical protein